MISVVTWNMDYWKRNKEQRQDAWDYLTDEIRPDIALLQECVPPPDMSKEYNVIYREIGGTRNWGSAVLTRGYPIKEVQPSWMCGGYRSGSAWNYFDCNQRLRDAVQV